VKVTRADVANAAGVSTATVSFVLNGSRHMSEKTRKRVLDAVEKLNYTPDMVARSMTTNQTMQVSLLVNDITNPFYSEIVLGFETAAIEKGYFVNVCTGSQDISRYLDNYIARRIDGVFVAALPERFDSEKLYGLVENGIKVVISGDRNIDTSRISSLENDYLDGMRQAVSFLAGKGHRKVAYLSGLAKIHTFDQKIEGYLAAVKEFLPELGEKLLVEGQAPYSTRMEDGFRMMNELLDSGKDVSAIICQNDLMAMGAIAAIKDRGLRVPEDLSVVGFDGIMLSESWRPALTTVSVPKYELGRKAFEMLYQNLMGGTPSKCLNSLELIERQSTR